LHLCNLGSNDKMDKMESNGLHTDGSGLGASRDGVAVKKFCLLVIPVGLLGAGLVWWLAVPREPAVGPDAYELAAVEVGTLSEVVSATGVVQPREVFTVGTERGGKVVAVLADFNQEVEEGDVLARLDDAPARDRLTQAELAVQAARAGLHVALSQRDTAQRALRRERERSPDVRRPADADLLEGNLRQAEASLDAARVKLRQAEEELRQAGDALRRTEVRAPVLSPTESPSAAGPARPGTGVLGPDGVPARPRRSFVVLERRVSLGQVVGPPASAHLFTLAAGLEQVRVVAQVAEGDVGKVVRGQRVRFTAAGADEPVFPGRVDDVRSVPATDHGAVFYQAVIDARNDRDPGSGEWRLRPGQTASVEFVRRGHANAWKLPAAALDFQPDDALLTDAARARLRRGPAAPDPAAWRAVWVVGTDGHPWPVFVRVGGRDARGEEGIQEGPFAEALEWDPELRPAPDRAAPATFPRPITGTPGWSKGGWFSGLNLKF
jgi:HlyD family secretion protein